MILGTRASSNLTVGSATVVSKHLHDFVINLISPLGIRLILNIMQVGNIFYDFIWDERGGISKYLLKKQSAGGELCIQPWSRGEHMLLRYYSSLETFISVGFVEPYTCPGSLSPKTFLHQSSFFGCLWSITLQVMWGPWWEDPDG